MAPGPTILPLPLDEDGLMDQVWDLAQHPQDCPNRLRSNIVADLVRRDGSALWNGPHMRRV